MSRLDNTTIPFAPFVPVSRKFKLLTGRRFGRWLVLSLFGLDKIGGVVWLCQCDGCKQLFIQPTRYLTKKNVCACKDCSNKVDAANIKHGETLSGQKTPEYTAYSGAKSRCTNPNRKAYGHYGGRGIEFRFTSFEQFLETLGRKPTPQHSLDRYPDQNGHYEPGNVRWATKKEQSQNTGRNRYFTIKGERKCLTEWCVIYQVHLNTVANRLDRGWPLLKALTST